MPLPHRGQRSLEGAFEWRTSTTEIEDEIPRLRRYARALTRDVNAADDLVQDCLARALSKIHLWQQGTDLRAWLFTILHNQYVNHVRRAVREGAAVGLSDTEPMLTTAPNQGKRLELRDLERAIARLPEEQRSVLLLVGLEGMRYEEVADGARRTRRHRALAPVARPRDAAPAHGPCAGARARAGARRAAAPAPFAHRLRRLGHPRSPGRGHDHPRGLIESRAHSLPRVAAGTTRRALALKTT